MRLLLLLASAAAISKVPKAPRTGRAAAISSETPQKPTTGRAAAKADPKPLALSGGGNKKQVSYAWAVRTAGPSVPIRMGSTSATRHK